MAMDHESELICGVTAEVSADAGKKILTTVSPFYANTLVPNTFTVLTHEAA